MKVSVLGKDGPVARATRDLLLHSGHELVDHGCECVIYFPGETKELEDIVKRRPDSRLVLRSHAYVYGSSTKNPGMLTEERISLLPANAPERSWLGFEAIATQHRNSAVVRLTNTLGIEEGDFLVRQLSRSHAVALAGHDPEVQFLSVEDAARVLVAAAEGRATGLFNAAGEGVVPLKRAFRAAGVHRIPIPRPWARISGLGCSVDQAEYNWTISSKRAERELGWRASRSTTEALSDFISGKPGAQPSLLDGAHDDWGLDVDYIRAWGAWFWFLRNIYWRIDHEGLENIPQTGRALFVSNHRGFMPLDAVMHLSLIFTHRQRIPRFLIIHSLLRFPFLCNFLTKLGGVIASQENAAKLFADENLVGLFPEGIRGSFLPYKRTYKLRDFSKSAMARMAIEHQAPVIPAAVVGHSEIFPILGRINSSYVSREWGWPYLPIAPPFPLAPVPWPSKWHVRVLTPVPLQGLRPADAGNSRLVSEFSAHIQHLLQTNIDDLVKRRKHVFWGRVLGGTAPAHEPLPLQISRATGDQQ